MHNLEETLRSSGKLEGLRQLIWDKDREFGHPPRGNTNRRGVANQGFYIRERPWDVRKNIQIFVNIITLPKRGSEDNGYSVLCLLPWCIQNTGELYNKQGHTVSKRGFDVQTQ